jgi:hypothetical protein
MNRRETLAWTAGMASSLLAGHANAQKTRELPAGQEPAKARLSAFAWMAGRWVGEGLDSRLEEVYSPPAGGVMLGHFLAYDDKGASFYELITLREESGSVTLRLRHFNADLTAWEDKNTTVEFPLVAIEKDHFYFSGLTIERVSANETRHFVMLKSQSGGLQERMTHYVRAAR